MNTPTLGEARFASKLSHTISDDVRIPEHIEIGADLYVLWNANVIADCVAEFGGEPRFAKSWRVHRNKTGTCSDRRRKSVLKDACRRRRCYLARGCAASQAARFSRIKARHSSIVFTQCGMLKSISLASSLPFVSIERRPHSISSAHIFPTRISGVL